MLLILSKIYAFCLNIFFPNRCLICGKYGEIVCFECIKKVQKITTLTCPNCGKISEQGRYCKSCKSARKGVFADGIVAAVKYEAGPIKELIYQFKYYGFTALSLHLGELICHQLGRSFCFKNTVLVPVPLHIKRKNQRGFNQSELLARYISAKLGIRGGDALKRTKNTPPQAALSKKDRLLNISDAFVCEDPDLVYKKTVILIDDVASTGATINECAKALKKAGARKVFGFVVAKNI